MKSLITVLILFIVSEVWLLQPKTKIALWQADGRSDSSIAVTPQIMILRKNFEDILDAEGIATIPLGSQSKSDILLCEESNGMIRYRSDRYGFRNPDEAWDQPVAIAMVGDSFAQGACVADGSDIASHLRKSFGNVLNLGSLGNGPIGDLAVLSEYLREPAPKRILWFYVANDLFTDMSIEEPTALLAAYKDPAFTQALKFRQPAVDQIIASFLKDEAKIEGEKSSFSSHLRLSNLQNFFTRLVMRTFRLDSWRQAQDMDYARTDSIDYEAYAEILRLARERMGVVPIDLVIVPDAGMFSASQKEAASKHIEKIEGLMKNLGIRTLDLRKAFRDISQPLSYYAIKEDGSYGHFTPEGYTLVSDYLSSQIPHAGAQAER